MRVAGYMGSDKYLSQKATQLLSKPQIVQAIKDRSLYIATSKKAIADREERQKLWTDIMRNNDPYHKEEFDSNGVPIKETNIPIVTRLKASELLGKSEADFIDKLDVQQNVTITELIKQSYSTTDDIDAIEAEYEELREKKELQQNITIEDTSTNSIEDFL